MPSLTLLPTDPALAQLGGAEAFGNAVRLLRTAAGITQRDLAEREGLHRNYLGALERGTVANPGLATVDRLARALGVSVSVLAESFVLPLSATAEPGGRAHAAGQRRREPSAEPLGRALRLLRRRRELTRAVLAERTGMHKNYIGSLEEGAIASPGLLTVTRLVIGLQCGRGDDLDLLAEQVGTLARVFAGEDVQPRAIAA
ncbi:helix-turn-helix transcriptional regulator [Conexibacter sp. JD483]|uniref:helix-turn-helix domain-containing protein n=1 Tax=unclassified Conexibacter TaxID=2627773 RepID=UPI0027254DE6|nr:MULTISPECIES: helix-turn-helix transcriptional regulator [unclassified Conexibacter]MDO8186379.1 helix-turn-helix transcriptional regulator [Conexibacter sp. CPCC 205706]MDO8199778.1 helix-turn-helix transcriptional regulator [Conexibacter sp. CPCC 205762]MDR9369202.1 helix-turn-helix transcriptional regulator [Conexibacter sp. JD483]